MATGSRAGSAIGAGMVSRVSRSVGMMVLRPGRNQGDAKAQVVEPVRRPEVGAERRAAEHAVGVPAAAPDHPVGALGGAARVRARAAGVVTLVVPVRAP